MTDKYEIDLLWSDGDQVFVAEVPELPGCLAHGATREEALAEAQQAIEGWLEVAREAGEPIPVPRPPGFRLA